MLVTCSQHRYISTSLHKLSRLTDLRAQLQSSVGNTYTLERELGGGGMSRVFTATERALDRTVVLKVLPPELARALSTDRFRQEIRLAARLQHLHIVPLLTAGEADGLLYYTMPFVEGESLRTRLAREGELPVRDAVKLLSEVAEALAYAHEHGVVHRDIKPDNVLLSGGHALVADFGVAKALSAAATPESTGLTDLGVALGTPAYMAPEQAVADPHVDHRADLYAWGCLAYECLTGSPPFVGRSTPALLAAHATEAPESILRRRSSLPPSLAALVMRTLEKRPADRPQSAGELLHQLEAVATPSGGTEPTVAIPVRAAPSEKQVIRRWSGAAAIALVVIAGGVGYAVWRGSTTRAPLDADLVAVAPFDVIGADLGLWREGFVDLLSRNLDGAGPLKTVSPTVVIRRWSGRADPASAATLGHRTGAGLVVFGTLVAAGPDSVRMDAAILDAAQGKQVGEVQLRGDPRRMDLVADSLSLALLRELGRSRPVGAVRLAGLTGTSPPALKAFLQGEQFYRRGAWDSARTRYEAALALDSTMVPAMRHLAQSLWWSETGGPAESLMSRAGRLNHGLAPRDSLLVVADSLSVALGGDLPDTVWRPLRRRYLGTLEGAARRYPSDPEIWYMLGEARFHGGWEVGATDQQSREAFDHAIALDSSFAPAFVHMMALGLASDGIPGWDRYAAPYLARSPRGDWTEGSRVTNAVLHTSVRDTVRLDSILAAATPFELTHSLLTLYKLTDSAELAVRVARASVASTGDWEGFLLDPRVRREFLAGTLGFRGHLREAYDLFRERDEYLAYTSLPGEMALLGGIPPDSAQVLFRHWVRERPLWPPGEPPYGGAGAGQLYFALPWLAARGDTLSLRLAAARLDSAARVAKENLARDMGRYAGASARAYLALARHDTSAALAGLTTLPHDYVVGMLDRLVESQLLAARGRDREALAILDREMPWYWVSPLRVMWALERARVAERTGDRKKSIDDYQYVAEAWRHADPVLQPYVQESRSALQRLTGEPAR